MLVIKCTQNALISSQHPEASIQAVFSDAQMHIWALEGKQFLFPGNPFYWLVELRQLKGSDSRFLGLCAL